MFEPEGEFIPPPEAPVFEPTSEEFQDPLGYIAKIRPIAEKSGICKVKPPAEWQPPFAVDVESFRFVPRVQRLNELEAKTRIKLNYLDKLAKFWELQGTPLKIPYVEKKYLDLHNLQKIVNEEGGYEMACRERKWSKITTRMGYPPSKGIGSTLRNHYDKLLYPFDVFNAGTLIDQESRKGMKVKKLKAELEQESRMKQEVKYENGVKEENTEVKSEAPNADETGARRSSRRLQKDCKLGASANKELARLQFIGAGPKVAVFDTEDLEEAEPEVETKNSKKVKMRMRDKKPVSYNSDLHIQNMNHILEENKKKIDAYMCNVCGKGDGEEYMLLCDGCDDAFHTYCLIPAINDIPRGDWRCPKCVAKECNRPKEAYGFEQAKKEYSLHTFGEMADQFKLDYFNMPVHMVPCSTVEKEFWRLVNCIEEDVIVEYGADIHAADMGSGFPTEFNKDVFGDEDVSDYEKAGWNLNNLPVLDKSVLRHINGDISGMKIPWCYVGMCFSSFCWHIEDHWSYSINYLHWGEPKTWYGVPGGKAELLEECMRKNAPELFDQSPDLLHQLTTIMNPNILMTYGVPIVRTNQHAGEFVITFPRSYHAGFNQGYNFAEAVNFAPADWIKMGRNCVGHYRRLHRQCVFSHEELVCKMAANPEQLDLTMAAAVHGDMLTMVENEKKLRKKLLDNGTTDAEREAFELLPDDERQCEFCKTTCFLSAVTCSCLPNKLVCLLHTDKLCLCPASNHCLRYRYTLDELPAMLHRLKVRAESFDNWANRVKTAVEAPQSEKLEMADLKELVIEAAEKKFPDSPLLQSLEEAISEAEKCASVATQLVTKKMRTRCRQSGDSKYIAKLSLEELQGFSEQMNNLPCKIKEATLIEDLLQKVLEFQEEANGALNAERPDSQKLEKLVDFGVTLDVELHEIASLKQLLNQAKWLDEVQVTLEGTDVNLDSIRKLIDSGVGLVPHPACEKAMAELQELLTRSERWEEKARLCIQAKPRHLLPSLECIVQESQGIPAFLPNVAILKEAVRKAKEWISKVDTLQNGEHYPYLDALEALANKGRPIPVRLDRLPQLESQVAAAKSWRERTSRTFLKKNSTYSLVDVLSPRGDIGVYTTSKSRRKKMKESDQKEKDAIQLSPQEVKVEEHQDPATIVAQFKKAEIAEVESMRELRTNNVEKQHRTDGDVKYCVCRRGPAGFMLQCELCKDWFHSSCAPLPKSTNWKGRITTNTASAVQAARELKFLCPLCLRSRRPRLETILALLVSLQKLPVRLPEGEALQCLTERAMAWQDRARQALATEELAGALATLTEHSQRMVEAAAREKTEKIISAELMKAANNPDLQNHVQTVQQNAFSSSTSAALTPFSEEEEADPALPLPPPPEDTEDSDETQSDIEMGSPPMGPEHTYSTASKMGPSMKNKLKKVNPYPKIPNEFGPFLKLTEFTKAQLEELMMEGDVLEVSLDETQQIWKILQACQNEMGKVLEFEQGEAEKQKSVAALSEEKVQEKKKKRKDDLSALVKVDIDEKVKKKKIKLGVKTKDGTTPKDIEKKKRKKKKKLEDMMKSPADGRHLLQRQKEGTQRMTQSGVMIIDEEDDVCSALKCLRPTGEEVSWVQCDKCEEWFHMICIGVAEDEISENEDYICFQCRNPHVSRPVFPPLPDNKFLPNPKDTHMYSGTFGEFGGAGRFSGAGEGYVPQMVRSLRRSSDFSQKLEDEEVDDFEEDEDDFEDEEDDFEEEGITSSVNQQHRNGSLSQFTMGQSSGGRQLFGGNPNHSRTKLEKQVALETGLPSQGDKEDYLNIASAMTSLSSAHKNAEAGVSGVAAAGMQQAILNDVESHSSHTAFSSVGSSNNRSGVLGHSSVKVINSTNSGPTLTTSLQQQQPTPLTPPSQQASTSPPPGFSQQSKLVQLYHTAQAIDMDSRLNYHQPPVSMAMGRQVVMEAP